MKKHGFRSIFSLLLAVMMVCSMLPTAAFAEGDVEEQSVVVEPGGTPAEEPKQDEVKPPEGGTSQGPAKSADAAPSDAVVPGSNRLTVPPMPNPDDVAPAALDTGHKIDVRFTVLYVGSEFNIGYNYGSSEKTKFVCQYTTNHSDTAATNHTIAISDIKAAAGRATVNSGYQIVGWSKESNANPKTLSLNMSGTTACNKGTTIYLVAKNPNPTTKYTYVLKYDANDGTGAPSADSWSTTDASTRLHSFTVTSTVPTRAGYTFKGWKGKANDGSDEIYTGGMTCAVSQYGNDVVQNDNTWTRTLYAVWEENRPSAAWNEISKALGTKVYVQCVSDTENHAKQGYELRCETSAVGRVRGGYACNVYVYAKGKPGLTSYVDEYNTTYPNTNHVLDDSDTGRRGFELRYNDGGDGWYIYKGDSVPIVFNVKCEEQQPQPDKPTAPGEDEVARLYHGAVTVKCTNESAGHESESYDLTKDDITDIGTPSKVNDNLYSCDVTIASGRFVAQFNAEKGNVAHEPANTTKIVKVYYANGIWFAPSEGNFVIPIVFEVVCNAQPQPDKPGAPGEADLDKLMVSVFCEKKRVEHRTFSYRLSDGDYALTNVDDFTYTVTAEADKYVALYNTVFGDHTVVGERTQTITLTYVADTGWTAQGTIKFPVECKTENPPVDIRKPTFDELKKLLSVMVECTNESATHELKFDRYNLKDVDEDSKFAIGEVDQSGDAPTCTVTIGSQPYVAAFDGTTGKAHEEADTTKTVDLVYNKETGKWALKNADDATVVFSVACTTEEPSKPYKPNAEDLWLSVVIHCKSDVHNDGLYDLTNGNFTVGEVEGNEADGYTCKVTVEAAQYVNKYVGEMKVNHDIVGEDTKTVTLKYESAFERWTVDSTVVTFDVECIPAPNISMLQVQVHCVTPNSSHMDEFYDLPEDTTLEYVDANTRKITVQAAPYVEQYGNGHKLADGESESKTITATWDGVKWNFDATSVTFDVKCTTQEGPAAPTAEQVASLLKVKVSCANLSAAHQENVPAFVYQPLLPGSFDIGEVTDSAESGYACRITVRAALYVQDFNTRSNATHTPTDGTEKAVTLYYEDGGWTVGTGSGLVEFTVICENVPAQKYTVTYTDGVDGVEIFKDQVYADLTAGTATPKFDGTPTRVGYFFAGWNPAVDATVTGNVTYAATWKVDSNNNGKPDDEEERYTVTYLDGANGRAFASQVYPGLLSGTATPKFNGTPVRSGYVFIGWSPVWSGTVTGNVTYTATWSTITGGLDKVPKTGDNGLTLALSALLLFSFCGAAACVVSTKKRG